MSAPSGFSNTQNTNSVHLRADFSEVAHTLNCILYLNRNLEKNITVDIECDSLKVDCSEDKVVFNFTDIELSPHTCRGLKYLPTGELHFSIQGRQLTRSENESCRKAERSSLSVQNGIVEKIQVLQNKWHCAVCRQKILKDSCFFSRVLPLPSENWSDMADMWFCHRHDDDGQLTPNNGQLLPRQGECFVGETYVLLNQCHINVDGAKMTPEGGVLCYRCGRQIGVTVHTDNTLYDPLPDTSKPKASTSSVVKLFSYAVLMKDVIEDMHIDKPIAHDRWETEHFFTRFLLEQSETYASYRFILETSSQSRGAAGRDDKRSCCLVWLLDTHAAVFSSLPAGIGAIPGSRKDGPSCTMVRTTVMKLLYKCRLCSDDLSSREPEHVTNSVIALWRKDNSVHGVTLPHPLMLQLISTLVQNTQSLPAAQRYLNGYHVSFLQHRDNS